MSEYIDPSERRRRWEPGKMTKTFAIQWFNHNGIWKTTEAPLFATRAAANKALRQLGLDGSPAYRVQAL